MTLVDQYCSAVEHAINCAELGKTKLTKDILQIDGMSSDKVRIFLNELVGSALVNPVNYLEVGVWHGSTFVSALYKNHSVNAYAIDNFSQFGATHNTFVSNCKNNNITNFSLYNTDCFNLSQKQKDSIKDINIYLYDGGHTREEQKNAITKYINHLSDTFILIVDDWEWDDVQGGTYDALLEYTIANKSWNNQVKKADFVLRTHKTWQLPARKNGDKDLWWNGLFVAVCSKNYE